jgi:hypothetical protein
MDAQVIELAGRNWLASELQRAGIEVARPERDRGIDLIAYSDLDERVAKFVARPIQMKASGLRMELGKSCRNQMLRPDLR